MQSVRLREADNASVICQTATGDRLVRFLPTLDN